MAVNPENQVEVEFVEPVEDEDEATLFENVRMIVGGVVGLALVVVPVILIRKLVKTIEGSDTFGALSRTLSR